MNRTRVLLADDNRAVRESVAALLEWDFDVVGTAADGREMLMEAARLEPEVVVLDISMPILDGIQAAGQLQASGSAAKVVFLTVEDRAEFIVAGLAAGALGYVVKRRLTSDLIPAIYETIAGRRFVSPVLHYQDTEPSKKEST